jgi:hypothetical protein
MNLFPLKVIRHRPSGVALLLVGLSTCLIGEVAGLLLPVIGLEAVASFPVLGNALSRQVTVTGMFVAASGLLLGGILGLRNRGPRPGLLLMTGLGAWFFLGHLFSLVGSYRTLFLSERYRFISDMGLYRSVLVIKILICLTLLTLSCLTALLTHVPGRAPAIVSPAGGYRRWRSFLAARFASARARWRRSS